MPHKPHNILIGLQHILILETPLTGSLIIVFIEDLEEMMFAD